MGQNVGGVLMYYNKDHHIWRKIDKFIFFKKNFNESFNNSLKWQRKDLKRVWSEIPHASAPFQHDWN